MRLTLLPLALALAACHHDAAKAAEPGSAGGGGGGGIACAKVAEHLIGMMAAEKGAPQDAVDKMTGVVTQSCETTKWSEDAKACALTGKNHDEIHQRCEDKLTESQKADLNDRLNAAFATEAPAAGAGGAPANGPSSSGPPPAQPAMAPPPPPAKGGRSTTPSPKTKGGSTGATSGDPCDGSQ